jgi:DNA-binding CsgD family transcriptional regulator
MLYSLEILGVLELSLGDPAATLSHLQPLVNVAVALGIEEPSQNRFMPEAIEANVALGNLDGAETLLEPFERNSTRLERIWGLASAGRCRGLLLAARGDVAAGIAELEAALETHRRLPMPLELGRTLLAMGQVQRRAKHKREARANLEKAMAVFDRLGASLWSERARAELMRVGVRGPAGAALTPTEERVARLVGEGMTNREVAARLYLSPRTVEVNLSRVYRKLGVRSRVALTRQLAEQERTAAPDQ